MLPKDLSHPCGSESSDDSSEDYLIMSKSMIQKLNITPVEPVQPDIPSMRVSELSDDSEDEPVLSWGAVEENEEVDVIKNQIIPNLDEPSAAIGKPNSNANSFLCTPVRALPPPIFSSRPKLPLPDGWRKIKNTIGQD